MVKSGQDSIKLIASALHRSAVKNALQGMIKKKKSPCTTSRTIKHTEKHSKPIQTSETRAKRLKNKKSDS